jgi:hypothetical protein
MTREQLIAACISGFMPNYAQYWAEQVISTQSLPALWKLIMESDTLDLSKKDLEKFEFRSSYILETVFCKEPKLMYPFLNQFFELYPTVTNGSMRRHFAKICLFLIKEGNYPQTIERIAIACADWIIDTNTRVAVKVLALDILTELAKIEHWIMELLADVIESVSKNPSAGMLVRLRRIKKALNT